MRWIILSSASGAITAYIVTKVICIKFLGELEKIEKKHRKELLQTVDKSPTLEIRCRAFSMSILNSQ